jgi:hypothetical protein
MSVKCGCCHEKHDTVAQVRLCYENRARAQAAEREAEAQAAHDEAEAKAEAEMEARAERFWEEGPHGPMPEDPREVEAQMMDDLRRETAAIQERERQEDVAAYTAKMRRDDALMGDEEEAAGRLLDQMTGAPGRDMASTPQVDYVMDLLGRKEWPDTLNRADVENMPRAQVSKLIDALKAAPDRPVAAAEGLEAGMYIIDGDQPRYLRVYNGQRSGRLLVKELHFIEEHKSSEEDISKGLPETWEEWSYKYISSAAKFFRGRTDYRKMTVEEAKQFGRTSHSCCRCARRLDVPESVDAGIGPVCAGKEGWES